MSGGSLGVTIEIGCFFSLKTGGCNSQRDLHSRREHVNLLWILWNLVDFG